MTDEAIVQINSVGLLPEGLEIHYMRLPADVRKNGLVWQHVVLVPRESDYDDEIEAVQLALHELLADVLEDEALAEPIEPKYDDDEEDDE